ncbi:MAG: hypothetical protein QXV89_01175 [Candidatus Bathyarchaeia archaeon]
MIEIKRNQINQIPAERGKFSSQFLGNGIKKSKINQRFRRKGIKGPGIRPRGPSLARVRGGLGLLGQVNEASSKSFRWKPLRAWGRLLALPGRGEAKEAPIYPEGEGEVSDGRNGIIEMEKIVVN